MCKAFKEQDEKGVADRDKRAAKAVVVVDERHPDLFEKLEQSKASYDEMDSREFYEAVRDMVGSRPECRPYLEYLETKALD